VTRAAAERRARDRAHPDLPARAGREPIGHGVALVPSDRPRPQDLREMADQRQAKVLFATSTERRSARGSPAPAAAERRRGISVTDLVGIVRVLPRYEALRAGGARGMPSHGLFQCSLYEDAV
jgi:hypothetical protein